MPEREVLTLEPIADDAEVGRWLSAMEDCRRDTLKELDGLADSALDRRPPGSDNSLGSVLYHVALIEADWLLVDIFGEVVATSPEAALLPFTDRDAAGDLTHVLSESLAQHLDRLAAVRAILLDRLRPMPADDFHRPRVGPEYDVSPAWVIHHLPSARGGASLGDRVAEGSARERVGRDAPHRPRCSRDGRTPRGGSGG